MSNYYVIGAFESCPCYFLLFESVVTMGIMGSIFLMLFRETENKGSLYREPAHITQPEASDA